ncbi:MAG: hypothetical protein ACYC96_00415 [Fimbriimonadaceae bacterium]
MRVGALPCLLLVAASSQAQQVLDDFTSGSAHYSVTTGNTYDSQIGTMIGGDRTENQSILQNPFQTPLAVDAGSGYLSFSQGSGLTSLVSLGYGYTASTDNQSVTTFDLGLDLSKYTAFDLSVAYDAASLPATIELNNDPAKAYQFTVSPRSVPTDYLVGFNLFTGVDFSHVHQILITFQDPTSNSFTLGGSPSEFSAVSPAPEPASIVFIGLSVAGLISRRMRRNK